MSKTDGLEVCRLRYLIAGPGLIEQALQRTQMEIADPIRTTGIRSSCVCTGPSRTHSVGTLSRMLKREAEARIPVLKDKLRESRWLHERQA